MTTRITTEVLMSSMFTPHPGLSLRDDIPPALNLQVGEAATSPVMALRVERWLGRDHGSSAEKY